MDIFHYYYVIIKFLLVILILSFITSFAVQTWLILFKTKARAVGNSLTSMLEDIGIEKAFAKSNVDALFGKGSSIFGERLEGILNAISAYFLVGAPQNIGREEFLLLLLRKASSDKALAEQLGFQDEFEAYRKLRELQKEMLMEEIMDPSLPVQVWRTKAMGRTVPDLASFIFDRFNEAIDRVNDDVSRFGKLLSIIITLPLLLVYWPVDSINLINRLNNDQVLAAKLVAAVESNLPSLQKAQDEFLKCRENNKNKPTIMQVCEQSDQALKKVMNDMKNHIPVRGLFGKEVKRDLACKIPILNIPIPFVKDCKRAKLTPGIFVTWILVSLGSAFWLGLLNKMQGILMVFSKKLDTLIVMDKG